MLLMSKQQVSLVDEVQDKSTRKAFYIMIILKEQDNGCWNIKYVKATLKIERFESELAVVSLISINYHTYCLNGVMEISGEFIIHRVHDINFGNLEVHK